MTWPPYTFLPQYKKFQTKKRNRSLGLLCIVIRVSFGKKPCLESTVHFKKYFIFAYCVQIVSITTCAFAIGMLRRERACECV